MFSFDLQTIADELNEKGLGVTTGFFVDLMPLLDLDDAGRSQLGAVLTGMLAAPPPSTTAPAEPIGVGAAADLEGGTGSVGESYRQRKAARELLGGRDDVRRMVSEFEFD